MNLMAAVIDYKTLNVGYTPIMRMRTKTSGDVRMSKRKGIAGLPLETLCESARRLHTRHRQYICDGQPDRAEDNDPAATICSPNATGRTA